METTKWQQRWLVYFLAVIRAISEYFMEHNNEDRDRSIQEMGDEVVHDLLTNQLDFDQMDCLAVNEKVDLPFGEMSELSTTKSDSSLLNINNEPLTKRCNKFNNSSCTTY